MIENNPRMMNGDVFVPTPAEQPVGVFGHGVTNEMAQSLDLDMRSSDELFQEYRNLAAAANMLKADLTPAELARTREITGAWLASRQEERPLALPVPTSPAPAGTTAIRTEFNNPAYARLESLAAYLRHVPELQSITYKGLHFKLDAAEALVKAMRRRDAEQAARRDAGLQEEAAPDLGPDLVSAVEIIDWLPADRATRANFTKGLPNYAHPIPGRLRHIMDVLKSGFRKRVTAKVGAVSAAETVLQYDRAEMLERLYAEGREYYTSDGRPLRMISYLDGPEYDWLTAKVDNGQRQKYVEEGVWKPDAKGTPVRGQNVLIRAFMNPETDEPVAALREVQAQTWDEVRQTPSFRKFEAEGAFDAEGLEMFSRLADGRPVVEIAGLWKDGKYPPDVKSALYRFAVQDSIKKNQLWFMGVVGTTYRDLTNTYGHDIIRTIGKVINVEDEDAATKTRIRPLIVDIPMLLTDLLNESDAYAAKGDAMTAFQRKILLLSHLRDMDFSLLDPELVTELRKRFGNVGK